MKKHVKAKGCNNCDLKFQCKKEQETLLVCGKWKKQIGLDKIVPPIIRSLWQAK